MSGCFFPSKNPKLAGNALYAKCVLKGQELLRKTTSNEKISQMPAKRSANTAHKIHQPTNVCVYTHTPTRHFSKETSPACGSIVFVFEVCSRLVQIDFSATTVLPPDIIPSLWNAIRRSTTRS